MSKQYDYPKIFKQARAHLVKKSQPVTDFLTTRLASMYAEITPFLRAWVGKELKINHT